LKILPFISSISHLEPVKDRMSHNPLSLEPHSQDDNLDHWLPVKRGMRGYCPSCGKGKLYKSYLKQVDACSVCHEDLGRIRADDGPAWLTIFIVGHLLAPLIIFAMVYSSYSDITLAIAFVLLALGLCLAILPLAKGLFIAFVWRTKCEES
jgi:uncharacterized protein (DUF983 family)